MTGLCRFLTDFQVEEEQEDERERDDLIKKRGLEGRCQTLNPKPLKP